VPVSIPHQSSYKIKEFRDMNKNHLGSAFSDSVKEWEKANPRLRVLVEEKKEKGKKHFHKSKKRRKKEQ
jgi:hypothetical protein